MTDYTIVLSPLEPEDGGGYIGFVPDLPGCMGDGATETEALEDTRAAVVEWLATNRELGREIPEPGSALEKVRRRDRALIEAVRTALDTIDHKDAQIHRLEGQLKVLTKLMQDDSPTRRFAAVQADIVQKAIKAH